MSVLVIAECANGKIAPSTWCCVTAAKKIGETVDLFVAGAETTSLVEQAQQYKGISKVLVSAHADLKNGLAEPYTETLLPVLKGYSHVLIPSTTFGKNILPRLAARLGVGQISDVLSIESSDTFTRPIYAGNAIATIQSTDSIKLLSIRTTAFDLWEKGTGSNAVVEEVPYQASQVTPRLISRQQTKTDRPDLTAARVVVSGGRGLQSADNFKMIESLADTLGAAIGASRAAVDAGYVSNDYQVGQTGKVVAPDLYIAVGISGAIQHLAGMKDSKVIVAINKDPEAPIFQIADYGLVGDLFEILPSLTQEIKSFLSSKAS